MQMTRKRHLLTLAVLLAFSAVLAAGCSCDDDEFDGKTACEKLVAAANGVLTSCSVPSVDEVTVCGVSTTSCVGFSGCTPKADVDACVTAIKALSCDNVQSRSYAQAADCVNVLSNIDTACTSSDGDDDWD